MTDELTHLWVGVDGKFGFAHDSVFLFVTTPCCIAKLEQHEVRHHEYRCSKCMKFYWHEEMRNSYDPKWASICLLEAFANTSPAMRTDWAKDWTGVDGMEIEVHL